MGEWINEFDLPTKRAKGTNFINYKDKLIALVGYDLTSGSEQFDCSNHELKSMLKIQDSIFYGNPAVVVFNDNIHVLGGLYRMSHFVYNEFKNEYQNIGYYTYELPYDFYNGFAVVLNNEIHIMGGGRYGDDHIHKDHYKWDMYNNKWIKLASLPYELYNERGSVIIHNNEIHMIGDGGSFGYDHYRYSLSSKKWKKVSTLPNGSSCQSVIECNGEIHALETYSPITNICHHYKYNDFTNEWIELSPIPYESWGENAFVYNDKMYIIVGHKVYSYKEE